MRILLAGYEIGGQMQLLASTFRGLGHQAHALAFNSDFRSFDTDYFIPHKKLPFKRLEFMLKAINRYDVFHFFWGVSLLDFWKFYGLDVPILRKLGKKVVVHFRGSDIIDLNHFTSAELNRPPVSTERQMRKVKFWQRNADRVLVSTPNLLAAAGPGALLVPQVVDVAYWNAASKKSLRPEVVTVVHAPTRRAIKGTDSIIRAVENLKHSGVPVELRLLEGLSYGRVRDEMAEADIGVDQLLLGWYGKAAVEMMALGKPVVSYIEPSLMTYAKDLPIVTADENSLEGVLGKLAGDVVARESLGAKGVMFTQANHDVKHVAANLVSLYQSI